MPTHRLVLPSLASSLAYLARRPGLLARMTARADGKAPWRGVLLRDRAALFWLCQQARATHGPAAGWVVLAGRQDGLPRIHGSDGERIGRALALPDTFRQRLSFGQPALIEHGVLWLAWPMEKAGVDAAFGPGAWDAAWLARLEERAACRERLLERCLPGAAGPRDRERL